MSLVPVKKPTSPAPEKVEAENNSDSCSSSLSVHKNNSVAAAPVIHSFKDLSLAMRRVVLQQLLETCTHEELSLAHSLSDKLMMSTKPMASHHPENSYITKDLMRSLHPKLFPATRKILFNKGSVVQIDFLSWLPLELTIIILLQLDPVSLANLSLVSKFYYKLVSRNDYLWKKLCHRDYEGILDQLALEARLRDRKIDAKRMESMSWRDKFIDLFLTSRNWTSGFYKVQDVDERLLLRQNNPQPPRSKFYLSFDETKAISISNNSAGRVWSLINGQVISMLDGHEGMISTAKMSKRYIITGSIDSSVKIWSCSSSDGNCLKTLEGHAGEITCLYIYADKFCISGSEDCSSIVWFLGDGVHQAHLKWRLVGHSQSVVSVQCDEQIIVTGSCDNTIKIWKMGSGQCINTLIAHEGHIYALQFKDNFLVSG